MGCPSLLCLPTWGCPTWTLWWVQLPRFLFKYTCSHRGHVLYDTGKEPVRSCHILQSIHVDQASSRSWVSRLCVVCDMHRCVRTVQ